MPAVSRILGVSIFAMVFVAIQNPQRGDAQEKKKDPPAETKKADKGFESDADAKEMLKLVSAAAKSKDFHTSDKIGGGDYFWEDRLPQGGVLVGFELSGGDMNYERNNSTSTPKGARLPPVIVVKTIKPIFLTPAGTRTTGKQHGFMVSKMVRFEGKPGYAVGAINYNASADFIQGMSVTFMRIRGAGLDTKESYKSQYYGSGDPEKVSVLGGTGKPIIGISGSNIESRFGCNLGLRLQFLGPDTEKKKD